MTFKQQIEAKRDNAQAQFDQLDQMVMLAEGRIKAAKESKLELQLQRIAMQNSVAEMNHILRLLKEEGDDD
jgi:hypothetical protein